MIIGIYGKNKDGELLLFGTTGDFNHNGDGWFHINAAYIDGMQELFSIHKVLCEDSERYYLFETPNNLVNFTLDFLKSNGFQVNLKPSFFESSPKELHD